ncbi:SDR family NAD(P)-dependent oxidoreductase [Jatrophihabitans sp. DSM 45814]
MDLALTGKRAVVTGGSRGIGYAIAHQLASEGCDVVIVSRDASSLALAAATIAERSGRQVFSVTADTSDDDSVTAMAETATRKLGGVDILVNAAARSAGASGAASTISATKLREEIDVKALGYLRCCQAIAPQLVERGWGRIINIGGLASRQTGSLSAAMRNVAVTALTKTLADELGPQGVNVTALHPGITRTERIAAQITQRAAEQQVAERLVADQMGAAYAIGRIVEPAEIAYLAAFLASPLSVAVNGDSIACGGGKVGSIHY